MKRAILATTGVMMLMATGMVAAADGTGASRAFTSMDPKVVEARQLMAQGQYTDAETLMRSAGEGGDAPARQEMIEIIRRSRREYSLGKEELIEKLKKWIPDVTPADVDRWHAQGELTSKMVDGKLSFFRREPSNLFKLSQEATQRRDAHASAAGRHESKPSWKLEDHLKQVVEEAERTGKEFVAPVHHRIKYTVTITPADGGAKEGSLLRVWLPYPQEYRQQKNVKLLSMSPEGGFIAPNAVDGSPITGAPQRTVYFEKKVTDPKHEENFVVEFEFDSYAYYPKLDESKVQPLPADFDRSYLAERPPHIQFSPEIRKAVAEAVGSETNPLAKARKIYHWINANVRYAYEDEYCTIPSFSQKVITCRKGDCGIQATLFITMCRLAGVPARWQSGWETKVSNWSQHDWAECYIAPWGWLPIDQSYGLRKESDDPKVREFYIGHQDAYRLIVNLDYGRELQPPKPSLRSEPADFQVGEVEIDGKNVYYDEWDYSIEINRP